MNITWQEITPEHYTAWEGETRVASVKFYPRLHREVWDVCVCAMDCQDRYLCNEMDNWRKKMEPCKRIGDTKTLEHAKEYVEDVLAGRNKGHKLWFWYYWDCPRGITEQVLEWHLKNGEKFYKTPGGHASYHEQWFVPTLEEALKQAEIRRKQTIKDAMRKLKRARGIVKYWKDLKIVIKSLEDNENTD